MIFVSDVFLPFVGAVLSLVALFVAFRYCFYGFEEGEWPPAPSLEEKITQILSFGLFCGINDTRHVST